jgi:hypothetical protein
MPFTTTRFGEVEFDDTVITFADGTSGGWSDPDGTVGTWGLKAIQHNMPMALQSTGISMAAMNGQSQMVPAGILK